MKFVSPIGVQIHKVSHKMKHRATYPCVRMEHRARYPCVKMEHRARCPCVRMEHRARCLTPCVFAHL